MECGLGLFDSRCVKADVEVLRGTSIRTASGAAERGLKHPHVFAQPLDFVCVPFDSELGQDDFRARYPVIGVSEPIGAHFPQYIDRLKIGSVAHVRPVDKGVQVPRRVGRHSTFQRHLVSEELY